MKTKPKKNTKQKTHNLVIGSEGFVGSYLCEFLLRKGEDVTRFDIKRGAHEDARTARLPLHEFDRVYFLAWEVGGAKYLYKEDTQLHQLNWNVDILQNIMPQLHASKIPFIFVSSQLAEETDTVYGVTKKLGELWTRQIGGTCVRLWNVYGALEESNEKSHVIGDFVYQAIYHGKIDMMTIGDEKRQFVHIEDVCAGLHHVIHNDLHESIYDLSSFEWISVHHMATLVAKHSKVPVTKGTQRGSIRTATITKGKPPGWNPKINADDGIGKMVEYAKKIKQTKQKSQKSKNKK